MLQLFPTHKNLQALFKENTLFHQDHLIQFAIIYENLLLLIREEHHVFHIHQFILCSHILVR